MRQLYVLDCMHAFPIMRMRVNARLVQGRGGSTSSVEYEYVQV